MRRYIFEKKDYDQDFQRQMTKDQGNHGVRPKIKYWVVKANEKKSQANGLCSAILKSRFFRSETKLELEKSHCDCLQDLLSCNWILITKKH